MLINCHVEKKIPKIVQKPSEEIIKNVPVKFQENFQGNFDEKFKEKFNKNSNGNYQGNFNEKFQGNRLKYFGPSFEKNSLCNAKNNDKNDEQIYNEKINENNIKNKDSKNEYKNNCKFNEKIDNKNYDEKIDDKNYEESYDKNNTNKFYENNNINKFNVKNDINKCNVKNDNDKFSIINDEENCNKNINKFDKKYLYEKYNKNCSINNFDKNNKNYNKNTDEINLENFINNIYKNNNDKFNENSDEENDNIFNNNEFNIKNVNKNNDKFTANPKETMKSIEIDKFNNISERMKNSLKEILPSEFLTWIQENAITPIKSRAHVLIKSPSGTGKTLSYAIPLIDLLSERAKKVSRADGMYALIIVPTKELAKQTCAVFERVLKKFHWIHASAIFGSDKKKAEKSRIRKGINILISTPGRILDHLTNTKSLTFDNLDTLVIDEADLMLELGYERKFNEIMELLKKRFYEKNLDFRFDRLQMVLLSATLDVRVKGLCKTWLYNPVFIDATPTKLSLAFQLLSCNSQLFQTVIVVPTKWRLVSLIWFIYKVHFSVSRRAAAAEHAAWSDISTAGQDLQQKAENKKKSKKAVKSPAGLKDLAVSKVDPVNKDSMEILEKIKKAGKLAAELTPDLKEAPFSDDESKLKNIEKKMDKKKEKKIKEPNSKVSFKIILFVGSIYAVKFYALILQKIFEYFSLRFNQFGLKIFELHGSMEIKERMAVFDAFGKSEAGILISTDVAARGLDFQNVGWVIQFDPARSPVDYVHRVGRTARAGSDGSSALFLSPHEIDYLSVLKESGMEIGGQYELEELSKEWFEFGDEKKKLIKSKRHAIEDEGSNILNQIRKIVESSDSILRLASKCFLSSVKSYSSYPGNLRKYFNVRRLHIGHLAESMGVTHTPKEISQMSRDETKIVPGNKRKYSEIRLNYSEDQSKKTTKKPTAITSSVMTVSEFSSAIDQGPKTKKN